MKQLTQMINLSKFKEQVSAMRFSVPDLIIGLVVGIVINMIWC
jgi:hypothetical protein